MTIISESWDKILKDQFQSPNTFKIQTALKRDASRLCPPIDNVFNAYKLTPFEDVKVVILGQDPYHSGEAHGLSFSSKAGYPPSLKVIFKELKEEFNQVRETPNLTDWAEQGVLLLNSSLTTVRGQAGAHNKIGWDQFTGYTLMRLALNKKPKVFMLWGKDAKQIGERYVFPYDNAKNHLILTAVHPAAELYGDGTYKFQGCGHFRKANTFLGDNNRGRIKWV